MTPRGGVGTLPLVVLLGCALLASAAGSAVVSLYMSQDSGVLDLKWDDGPRHLEAQLVQLGLAVQVADGPVEGSGCYVIPAQNGASFYANAEDMTAVAEFVSQGGLVVMLDAKEGNGDAQKALIAGALGYEGSWGLCKSFGSNERHSNGQPAISAEAKAFLPGAAFPEHLEDARVTSVHTVCGRTDAKAVSWPLYHVLDDSNKVVAQAFGKVGSAGAVVWLGYSWKDGPVAQWGALLRAVIHEFGSGEPACSAVHRTPLSTVCRDLGVKTVSGAQIREFSTTIGFSEEEDTNTVTAAIDDNASSVIIAASITCGSSVALTGADGTSKTYNCQGGDGPPPPTPPPSPSPPPPLPDNSFVLTVTNGVSSGTTCSVIQAAVNAASNTAISKADSLASAEHVWNERQLQELMPGSGLERMVQGAAYAAGPKEVQRLQELSAAVDYQDVERRIMQATGGNSGGFKLVVDLLVMQIEEVPLPPSPPPSPPRPFDAPALPPLPPSPPPKPPRPPPSPPFGAVLGALATQLNATAEVGFRPPAPKPPAPKPPTPAGVPVPKPKPGKSPKPSPPPGTPARLAKFKGLYGMGVYLNKTQPIVWYDTNGFRKFRTPRSSLNLIYWTQKYECGTLTPGSCVQCPRAWEATRNVTILFREPWQLDAIHIRQLQNPGVLVVELLPWPAVPIVGLVDSTGNPVPPVAGTLRPPVRNVTVDTSLCSSTLDVNLGARAGTDLPVPRRGSQASIPDSLKATAYGGINIIVKAQPSKGKTYIDSVTFDGRALYPADANFYSGNDVRLYG
ncbi:hypothetical protein TSOC_007625 [Tetrabaena socialis]|uniref:Uncharacterized protein n=1 Tax=Tetrabaena socialis TaxID=47790 RepID=A0A2J8A0K9_9CHLO|nr:hypothetical protein TSOC_007625 [Tetrabaena socialis]|eukprot:PNH06063.1 hypothetical protein TSOC_007625 [Tetrabaena socialis]